jgi:hypothetical protein
MAVVELDLRLDHVGTPPLRRSPVSAESQKALRFCRGLLHVGEPRGARQSVRNIPAPRSPPAHVSRFRLWRAPGLQSPRPAIVSIAGEPNRLMDVRWLRYRALRSRR